MKNLQSKNNFPSFPVLGITFLILIAYLTYNFTAKLNEDFWQSNYDWSNSAEVLSLSNAELISLNYNRLELGLQQEEKIPKGHHVLGVETKKTKYYFSYAGLHQSDHKVAFTAGFWLTGQPPSHLKDASFQLIDLPLKQNGNLTVDMIIDSQLMWRDAQSFRKELSAKNTNIRFVGMQKDVYGFPYNGGILNSSAKTIEHVNEIKKANVYLIQLGAHEPLSDLESTVENFKTLLKSLQQKNPEAVIYIINNPPSTNLERNTYILQLNDELSALQNKNIKLIDFYDLLKDEPEKYITKDHLHYHKEAYELLIKRLTTALHEH